MNNTEQVEVLLSDPQEALLFCRMVDMLNMAGQGGGKSHTIGLITGQFITMFPRCRGFIGANTFDQLSGATLKVCYDVWRKEYGMTEYSKDNPGGAFIVDKRPPGHFQRFVSLRSYKNVISFWNGCIVFIGSLDNYMAQDGKEYVWAQLDETKDTKEEAVKDVIKGRLRQVGLWFDAIGDLHYYATITEADAAIEAAAKKGQTLTLTAWNPLYIHTSPASGLVKWINEWFGLEADRKVIKDKCLAGDADFYFKENPIKKTAAIIYSAYHNKHNLAPGYLENRAASLGEDRSLKLIHGYPFSKSGGEWFTHFSRLNHVKEVNYNPELRVVHLTWDFNVVPYITCLGCQIEFITRFIDNGKGEAAVKSDVPQIGWRAIDVMRISVYKEYCFENPKNDVTAVCNQFIDDTPPGSAEVFLYGDATGKIRKPGLGQYTDFGAIEDQLWAYVHNESDRAPRQNVAPGKRRDLMNDIMSGRVPEVEIVISDNCEILIQDMEEVKQAADGSKKKPKKENPDTKEKYEYLGHTSDALEYLVSIVAKQFIK